jgi:hypothetical protein
MQDEFSQDTGPTSDDTTTCGPSHPKESSKALLTFEDGWLMLFAEDFHARTSALPVGARESMVSVLGFGESFTGSFAFFDLDSSLWKTHQRCLDGDLEAFSATWPVSGMTRSGIAFRVPPSVPFISGTGSFFWPTPTANSGTGGNNIEKWGGSGARKALRKRIEALQATTMFTTPTADDTGHRKKRYSQGGEALSFQIGGPVNPEWEEWLMGFPMGWTAVDASETPSCPK